MRVLFLTTSFPATPEDPVVFFIRQLAESLAGHGCRITVLTPAGTAEVKAWPSPLTVHRFRYAPRHLQTLAQLPGGIPAALRIDPKKHLLLPSFLGSFVWNIRRLARKNEIILANWAVCGALAGLVRPSRGRGLITVVRGSDAAIGPDGQIRINRMLAMALKSSGAVVAVGQELAHRLKSCSPFPEKVHHVPNGVSPSFFEVPPPPGSQRVRALFIGFLSPRKGVDVLIKALALVPGIDLTVVGDGPSKPGLVELTESLGLSDRILFHGLADPGEQVARIMAESDFLVLPSHLEGRPNVVLEAMAGARPIVATNISGLRELVGPSRAGFLVPPNDPPALARAMERLARSRDRRIDMGTRARAWIRDQGLTWDNAAGRYIDLMHQLTAASGPETKG